MQRLLSLFILFAALSAKAQPTSTVPASYTFKGRIEYERKVNIHRLMEGEEWYAQFKDKVPKFHSTYFDLFFAQTATLYKPGRDPENPNPFAAQLAGPASANVVFTDLATRRATAAKDIFEEKYLIEDSIRITPWKLLDEVRTIAGYPCRKATTRMFDSVVIVAFYTDAIPVSGGPESFADLPGMILEVAIPRLNTTWIATKVELTLPTTAMITAPTKGKKTNTKGLVTTLQASLKDWGKWGARNVWWCVI